MAEIKISDEGLAQQIAKAIRDAVADDDDCLADEEACFERHPVHLGWSVEGEIRAVYARVDGLAQILAAALVASGWRREQDVLREAAEHLRQREREMVERGRHSTQGPYPKPMLTGVTYAADVLSARASEAEQYVSAGTREGEDQERDEEQEHG